LETLIDIRAIPDNERFIVIPFPDGNHAEFDRQYQMEQGGFDHVGLPGSPLPQTAIPILLVLLGHPGKPAILFYLAAQTHGNDFSGKP